MRAIMDFTECVQMIEQSRTNQAREVRAIVYAFIYTCPSFRPHLNEAVPEVSLLLGAPPKHALADAVL